MLRLPPQERTRQGSAIIPRQSNSSNGKATAQQVSYHLGARKERKGPRERNAGGACGAPQGGTSGGPDGTSDADGGEVGTGWGWQRVWP